MKKVNVKLFKQFLEYRGLDKMFKGLYKSYRFDDNPEDFDKYLEEVDSHYVITLAFDVNRIKSESDFNGHFWATLNKKWIKYMKAQADHGYYDGEIRIPRIPVKNADGSIHVSPTAPSDEAKKPSIMTGEHENQKNEETVDHDWSGLDLVPVSNVGKRQMESPAALEIRVCTTSGNTVVLSTHISGPIIQFGLDTADVQVDRNTNQLVLLFGKGLTYNVRKYSSELFSISHKAIIENLQKYIKTKFDPKKAYFIKVKEKVWNKDHTKCAVIVTTDYTEKER